MDICFILLLEYIPTRQFYVFIQIVELLSSKKEPRILVNLEQFGVILEFYVEEVVENEVLYFLKTLNLNLEQEFGRYPLKTNHFAEASSSMSSTLS